MYKKVLISLIMLFFTSCISCAVYDENWNNYDPKNPPKREREQWIMLEKGKSYSWSEIGWEEDEEVHFPGRYKH